jgi:integrase
MSKPENVIAFTMQRLNQITPPEKGRNYYRDKLTTGLVFVITCKNSRTFYFSRRIDGKPTRIKLGNFPDIGIDTARKAAHLFLGEIAQGKNPYIEIKSRAKSPTLQELFDHWLEVHGKRCKKTWKIDNRIFKKYVTSLHKKRLNAITESDIINLHTSIGKNNGKYQANRVHELLRSIYSVAKQLGYKGQNPCTTVERFPEQPRERFLLPQEFITFYKAVNKEKPLFRDLLLVTLFTGQRRSNVCNMKWKDIDFINNLWYVAGVTMKNNRPHTVVLSAVVSDILRKRYSDPNKHPEWVFPSTRKKDSPVINPEHVWNRVRKESGLTDLRIHDLRRTFGSWQAINGVSLQIIAESLGHKSLRSTEIYARLIKAPVREAVEGASSKMIEYCRMGNDEIDSKKTPDIN